MMQLQKQLQKERRQLENIARETMENGEALGDCQELLEQSWKVEWLITQFMLETMENQKEEGMVVEYFIYPMQEL